MISESWRFWVVVAGISGILGVGGGAFGYHWLEGDQGLRDIFSTAVQYHMWHTLALFGVAWLSAKRSGTSGR